MQNVEEALTNIGGNLTFSHFSISNETHHLHLLFQNQPRPTIVCGLLLQHKPVNYDPDDPSVLFIEGLDTTGTFEPRQYQSKFTKAFVVAILQEYKPYHLSCFAYPKDIVLFGKSSKNKTKRMLDAKNLCEYWIEILRKYNSENFLHVYSNYYIEKSHPYTNEDKVFVFDDDPIRKLEDSIRENCNVVELFEILQYKSDFGKGSLIFSVSKDKSYCYNGEYTKTDLDKMVNFLRASDLSSKQKSIEYTKFFIQSFGIRLKWFTTTKKDINYE